MAAEIKFFYPDDPLSLAGWELQSNTPNSSRERSQGLKNSGDEKRGVTYNTKSTFTLVYKNFEASGDLALPKVGSVVNGHHIDSISLALKNTSDPELSVTTHKHEDGENHAAGSCREYTPSITFKAGWGIQRDGIGFTLAAEDVAVGIQSVDYGLSVTHLDELGDQGVWLAGENRDGVETFSLALLGTGATITMPTDAEHPWGLVSQSGGETNEAADTETFEFEHHIEFDGAGNGG